MVVVVVVVVVAVAVAAAVLLCCCVVVVVVLLFCCCCCCCSPTLTVNNCHERAREESYALAKSSVLSRRRNATTDSWSSRSDDGSEFHVAGPAAAKLRGP